MTRFAQITCVVIFIVIMVAIHQTATVTLAWMGSDFTLGFLVGCAFCAILYFVIQKLEPGNSSNRR